METSNRIVDGLYLGGILAALNEKDLNEKGITHILSIDENSLPQVLTQQFNYKHVYALDMFETDLLDCFDEAFVFIEQAREAGGVALVHCQAGMSRGATIVASYLMRKMAITKDKALELIRNSRPFIRPNEAFMEQLDLFEKMDCQMINTNKFCRAYKLRRMVDKFQKTQYVQGSSDYDIPSDIFIESDFASEVNDAYYKCRKCRIILFRQGAVTTHPPGIGESAFDWRGKGPAKHNLQHSVDDQDVCLRSLFVDPLQWMKGKINTVSGKLHCPKCANKLGSFVWYGEKCPCGAWVAPAFHIDMGKVDKIPFHTVVPQTHRNMGASASPSGTSQGRPLSAFNEFPQRKPLNTSSGWSRSAAGRPVAVVAAVAPRTASQDAPSTSVSTSGMEIDELSLAVGTSSLGGGGGGDSGHLGYEAVRSEGNASMDVDS